MARNSRPISDLAYDSRGDVAAKSDKKHHNDAFIAAIRTRTGSRGGAARLLMLPYYGFSTTFAFAWMADCYAAWRRHPAFRSRATLKCGEAASRASSGDQRIEAAASPPMDDGFEWPSKGHLGDSALSTRYGFRSIPRSTSSSDGHVDLEGVVANGSRPEIANIRANSVPGVFVVARTNRQDEYLDLARDRRLAAIARPGRINLSDFVASRKHAWDAIRRIWAIFRRLHSPTTPSRSTCPFLTMMWIGY